MLIWFLQILSDFSVDHPFWTSLLTVFLTAQFCKWLKNSDKRYPPGPVGLPFLGYLPSLRCNAHQEITKWQQTYGTVFSLNIGQRYTVVLGDFKSVKEASKNECFSGNARGLFKTPGRTKHMGSMNPKDRKESYAFTLEALNSLTEGEHKLDDFMTDEITKLLDRFSGVTGRTEIHLSSLLLPTIDNITSFIVCGLRTGMNSDLTRAIADFHELSKARFKTNALPFFLPFISPALPYLDHNYKEVKRNINELIRLLGKEIEEHDKRLDPSSLEDYMDFFLTKTKNITGDPSTFTKGVLTGNSMLLLSSGVESTVSAIEWVLLLLAMQQEVQEKVYQEIVESWGQTTWPYWKDIRRMPYLEAVLMEVARFKPVAPLGSPHMTLSETTVGNYNIPKDALVLNNIQLIHMDPELWDEPDTFNPDRFMTPDKKVTKAPEYFMPFSYGERKCPGEVIGKMEVVTIVAAILQHFKILPPSSGLNLDENLEGLFLRPASPFVKIQSRNGS